MTNLQEIPPSVVRHNKVDLIILPMRETFATLNYHLWSICPGLQIDSREYVNYVVKNIFNEEPKQVPAIETSECRTMLLRYNFTQEQMSWVEHHVLMMAIELIWEAHAFIKSLSHQDLLVGFHWDIDQNYDLIISLSYK